MNIEWITLIDLSNSPKMKKSVQKLIEFIISLMLSANSIVSYNNRYVLTNCIKLHVYSLCYFRQKIVTDLK